MGQYIYFFMKIYHPYINSYNYSSTYFLTNVSPFKPQPPLLSQRNQYLADVKMFMLSESIYFTYDVILLTLSWRRPLSYRNQELIHFVWSIPVLRFIWYYTTLGWIGWRWSIERKIRSSVLFKQLYNGSKKVIGTFIILCFEFGIIQLARMQNFPCAYQGVRNVSFLKNVAHVRNEWTLFWVCLNKKWPMEKLDRTQVVPLSDS